MVRCEGNRLYGRVDESCVARGRRSTKGETDKRTSTKAQKKNRYALKRPEVADGLSAAHKLQQLLKAAEPSTVMYVVCERSATSKSADVDRQKMIESLSWRVVMAMGHDRAKTPRPKQLGAAQAQNWDTYSS